MNLDENKREQWRAARLPTPERLAAAEKALAEIRKGKPVFDVLRRFPLPQGGCIGKNMLVEVYNRKVKSGEWQPDAELLSRIRLKPMRTLSGVATVTVLTKPYPCPHECLFCPNEEQMPKSYISEEPGARRALEHGFDPYTQVQSRLKGLAAVGHPTEKVEVLILGGTWSAYPQDYQAWFVQRCFEALNEMDGLPPSSGKKLTLAEVQTNNETTKHRNVGLVIETRPDDVTFPHLSWLRRLGVTKVQLGAQSLEDRILALNCRGHKVTDTLRAVNRLRTTGFKVVLHWMPNLLGADAQSDRIDFLRLWQDGFCPDEIKIYPTQLLENAPLYHAWVNGDYQPYTTETLIDLIADIKPSIPRYCRVNRVIRDIPSTYVPAGNKRTSLRVDIAKEMEMRGTRCQCIRCREVKGEDINPSALIYHDLAYDAGDSVEHFLSFDTPEDKLAGFLRLSLPKNNILEATGVNSADWLDLEQAALIREVHVYGQSLTMGEELRGAAQHIGLGSRLMEYAEEIAQQNGFNRLAVIAAVGTRLYYQKRGYERGDLYLVKSLR